MNQDFEKQHRRGRIWGGVILVAVGAAYLAKTMNVLMPAWLFTWPVILILVGIYTLGKHGFQRPGGLIPITVGAVFLMERISPGMKIAHIMWPAIIILFGLFLILRPRSGKRKHSHQWSGDQFVEAETNDEDYINIDSVFGGVEKTVISKNFKGGQVNCVFGGAEINLMRADINGPVTLEISTVFGGTDITVPANWKVQSEISAILGGVQDQRPYNEEALNNNKLLILKGSVVFGGVSIKAY
jgi:predicted membrane protein